jgi:hypothetical protein
MLRLPELLFVLKLLLVIQLFSDYIEQSTNLAFILSHASRLITMRMRLLPLAHVLCVLWVVKGLLSMMAYFI